jgi:methyl-accepting chemotaxis protein
MIEGTVTRVHDGAKVAERSKAAFDRVVGNSRNAEKLVQEIARGSEVQVEGLQQVNVATEELNKLAQNNAENAEQLLSTNSR